jgi:SET domain-containing protein
MNHSLPGSRKERRLIRSFSLAPGESELLQEMQHKLSMTGRLVNESETIRAGLYALRKLRAQDLEMLLCEVERLKPGQVR